MTLTEKQKLQKRARRAVLLHIAVWVKIPHVMHDSSYGGIGLGELDRQYRTEGLDAAIRKELRRAVRLVKGRGK